MCQNNLEILKLLRFDRLNDGESIVRRSHPLFQRRSFRFFFGPNDAIESETSERHDVQRIYENFSTLRIRCGTTSRVEKGMKISRSSLGKVSTSAVTSGHAGNDVTLSQLDSSRLHFRNEHGQHSDRDVFHRSDVSQRHSALSDGNR